MKTAKRTYALPVEALGPFEEQVASGQRSAVVAALLREWTERQQRERRRSEIIAGCREMADVSLETEREFHPLEEEVQRALDA